MQFNHHANLSMIRPSAISEYKFVSCSSPLPSRKTSAALHNRLQFPCIPQRILNRHLTQLLLIALLIHSRLQGLVGEVDPAIFDEPTSALREGHNCPLAVEEEKVLCRGNGKRWVGSLATRGDLVTDLRRKDLSQGDQHSACPAKESRAKIAGNQPQKRPHTPHKAPPYSS